MSLSPRYLRVARNDVREFERRYGVVGRRIWRLQSISWWNATVNRKDQCQWIFFDLEHCVLSSSRLSIFNKLIYSGNFSRLKNLRIDFWIGLALDRKLLLALSYPRLSTFLTWYAIFPPSAQAAHKQHLHIAVANDDRSWWLDTPTSTVKEKHRRLRRCDFETLCRMPRTYHRQRVWGPPWRNWNGPCLFASRLDHVVW